MTYIPFYKFQSTYPHPNNQSQPSHNAIQANMIIIIKNNNYKINFNIIFQLIRIYELGII